MQVARKSRASVKKAKRRKRWTVTVMLLIIAGACIWSMMNLGHPDPRNIKAPDWITQDIIAKDGHSRSGLEVARVNDIVVHYVANPGSSAKDNRDYFNSSKSNVSAHFVVGLKGEIIQCVPMYEQSSASNQRNPDTISIEVCHPDITGEFSVPSYNSLVKLLVWLCQEYNLDEDNIIRHYDVTGKNCPKFYVEHPEEWAQLKQYVKERL